MRSDNFTKLLNSTSLRERNKKDKIFYQIGYYKLYDYLSNLINEYGEEMAVSYLPEHNEVLNKEIPEEQFNSKNVLNISEENKGFNEVILEFIKQNHFKDISIKHDKNIKIYNTLNEAQEEQMKDIKSPEDLLNDYEKYVKNNYNIEALQIKLKIEQDKVWLGISDKECSGHTPIDILKGLRDDERIVPYGDNSGREDEQWKVEADWKNISGPDKYVKKEGIMRDHKNKQFDQIKSLVDDKKLLPIKTNGNGNCGYHSLLYGIINHYNNNNAEMTEERKGKFNEFFNYVLLDEEVNEIEKITYTNQNYQDSNGSIVFNDRTIFSFRAYIILELKNNEKTPKPIFQLIDSFKEQGLEINNSNENNALTFLKSVNPFLSSDGTKALFDIKSAEVIKNIQFILGNKDALEERSKKTCPIDILGYHDQNYKIDMFDQLTHDKYKYIQKQYIHNLLLNGEELKINDSVNMNGEDAITAQENELKRRLKYLLNIDDSSLKDLLGYDPKTGSNIGNLSEINGGKKTLNRLLNIPNNKLPRGNERVGSDGINWMDLQTTILIFDISIYLNIVICFYIIESGGVGKRINIIDPIDSIKSSEGETNDFNDPIFIHKGDAHFTFLENRCLNKERIKKNLRNLEQQYKRIFKERANKDASNMLVYNPDTEGGNFQEKNSKFIEKLIEWYDSKIKIIFSRGIYSYDQIIYAEYNFMEHSHNYIQWLFPTDSKSEFKSERSPIINKGSIQNIPRDKILVSLNTYQNFLTEHADKKGIDWKDDHNNRRISRVIRCLNLFNLHEKALDFYKFIRDLLKEKYVDKDSVELWLENLNDPQYKDQNTIEKEKEYIGNPQNDEAASSAVRLCSWQKKTEKSEKKQPREKK